MKEDLKKNFRWQYQKYCERKDINEQQDEAVSKMIDHRKFRKQSKSPIERIKKSKEKMMQWESFEKQVYFKHKNEKLYKRIRWLSNFNKYFTKIKENCLMM